MSTANTSPNWADSLVDQIADAVYQRIQSHIEGSAKLGGDKLTFNESEAAELIGIPKHVLKVARERGEISPPKIGKAYRYPREMLLKYISGDSL